MTADQGPAGPQAPGAARSLLLTVRFLTELAMLAAFALAGARASLPLAGRVVLAAAAPLAAVVIWGVLLAPRAGRRLRDPWRLTAETVLFLAAAAGLGLVGQWSWALALGAVGIGTAVLVRLFIPNP